MRIFRKICFCLSLLATLPFFSGQLAFAEGSKTISISPSHEYVDLDPGDEYVDTFKVYNDGEEDFYYSINVSPYQASGDDYTLLSENNNFTEIADWISFSRTSGFLAAGESTEITYVINVPSYAHGGGQYAILSASFKNDNEDATVKISGSVGEIIYARISGDINIEGEILSNHIIGFTFNPPISAVTKVSNTGNVDNHLKSTLTVKNYFTNTVIYTNEKDPADSVVLPNANREITVNWNESPKIGIYKVNLFSEYLDETQNLEKVVIICPAWLLLIMTIIIIIVIVRIATVIHKRSKHKRARASKFSI